MVLLGFVNLRSIDFAEEWWTFNNICTLVFLVLYLVEPFVVFYQTIKHFDALINPTTDLHKYSSAHLEPFKCKKFLPKIATVE